MLPKPADGFVIEDTLYFQHFDNLQLPRSELPSPHLNAVEIYQKLLAFHKTSKDTAAYVDLEISRLKFIADEGRFDRGIELQKRALRNLMSRYERHPASALAGFELATILSREGGEYRRKSEHQFRKRDALALCESMITRFPNSDGARKCEGLKGAILATKIALTVERIPDASIPEYARPGRAGGKVVSRTEACRQRPDSVSVHAKFFP